MNPFGLCDTIAGDVLDSLPDGVYVTDCERHILFWNRTAEEITGWSRDEMVGQSCFDKRLAHEDIDGHPLCGEDSCPLHRAIESRQPSRLPDIIFATCKNGQKIPLEVSVAPIVNSEGVVTGGIELFRDLSPLMHDLERARIIQEHAMDLDIPDDPRVHIAVRNIPQEYVSGDLYRVEAIDENRYAILLADVMGHGVSSALYAMQIRSLWEEARVLLPSPGLLAKHMNEKLVALTSKDDFFATAFYCVLDAAERTITYIRAGHPSPFLIRSSGIVSTDHRGPALGMIPDVEYPEAKLTMDPGDRLLIYTDGAVEVRDKLGLELGEEGLRDLIRGQRDCPVDEAFAKLQQALLEYSGSLHFDDDVTFICIGLVE